MALIGTTSQACDLIECDRSTLTTWKKRGLDAYLGRNQWDLKLLVLWWVENIYDGKVSEPLDDSLAEARRLYWMARAEREQLRVAQEKSELIPRAKIAPMWASRAMMVKHNILLLAARIPPIIEGKPHMEIRAIIRRECEAIIGQYIASGKFCPDIGDDAITDEQSIAQSVPVA